MRNMKVFITRKIPETGLKLLKEAGCIITLHTKQEEIMGKELINACKMNDVLLSVGHVKIEEQFLYECRHLKAVSLLSVGYDNVDIKTATKLKIPVGHTPEVLSKATSDIAFLLMLAVSRKAFYMHNTIARGEWGFFDPTANLGMELYGKTLGIFGLGKIGFELAKKCVAAYDMNVVYHNRSDNKQAEMELNASKVSLDELLRVSDVLSVHAKLSGLTQGIFDKQAFDKMKRSAIFINTARGGIHNENDLINALQSRTIWGAGLDVTDPEPMGKNNPLLAMDNACVLPHIGSATIEARSAMATRSAQNIVAVLRGKKMPFIVNPEVYW